MVVVSFRSAWLMYLLAIACKVDLRAEGAVPRRGIDYSWRPIFQHKRIFIVGQQIQWA